MEHIPVSRPSQVTEELGASGTSTLDSATHVYSSINKVTPYAIRNILSSVSEDPQQPLQNVSDDTRLLEDIIEYNYETDPEEEEQPTQQDGTVGQDEYEDYFEEAVGDFYEGDDVASADLHTNSIYATVPDEDYERLSYHEYEHLPNRASEEDLVLPYASRNVVNEMIATPTHSNQREVETPPNGHRVETHYEVETPPNGHRVETHYEVETPPNSDHREEGLDQQLLDALREFSKTRADYASIKDDESEHSDWSSSWDSDCDEVNPYDVNKDVARAEQQLDMPSTSAATYDVNRRTYKKLVKSTESKYRYGHGRIGKALNKPLSISGTFKSNRREYTIITDKGEKKSYNLYGGSKLTKSWIKARRFYTNHRLTFLRKNPAKEFNAKPLLYPLAWSEAIAKLILFSPLDITAGVVIRLNRLVGGIEHIKSSFRKNKALGLFHLLAFTIVQVITLLQLLLDSIAFVATKLAFLLPIAGLVVGLTFAAIALSTPWFPAAVVGGIVILLLVTKGIRMFRERKDIKRKSHPSRVLMEDLSQCDILTNEQREAYIEKLKERSQTYPNAIHRSNDLFNAVVLGVKKSTTDSILDNLQKDITFRRVDQVDLHSTHGRLSTARKAIVNMSYDAITARVVMYTPDINKYNKDPDSILCIQSLHYARIKAEKLRLENLPLKPTNAMLSMLNKLSLKDEDLLIQYVDIMKNNRAIRCYAQEFQKRVKPLRGLTTKEIHKMYYNIKKFNKMKVSDSTDRNYTANELREIQSKLNTIVSLSDFVSVMSKGEIIKLGEKEVDFRQMADLASSIVKKHKMQTNN